MNSTYKRLLDRIQDDRPDRPPRFPLAGAGSLIIIFTVLCLITFTVLAMSSVQADARMLDGLEQSISARQDAENQAQAILARLRSGDIPPAVTRLSTGDDDIGPEWTRWSYVIPVSDKINLSCRVLTGPENQYKIEKWAIESTQPWAGDDNLPVFRQK